MVCTDITQFAKGGTVIEGRSNPGMGPAGAGAAGLMPPPVSPIPPPRAAPGPARRQDRGAAAAAAGHVPLEPAPGPGRPHPAAAGRPAGGFHHPALSGPGWAGPGIRVTGPGRAGPGIRVTGTVRDPFRRLQSSGLMRASRRSPCPTLGVRAAHSRCARCTFAPRIRAGVRASALAPRVRARRAGRGGVCPRGRRS